MACGPQFALVGSDIFYDNQPVAALLPHVWPTLADSVAALLECADEDAVSADAHKGAIEALETEIADMTEAHAKEVAEHEKQMRAIEDENDALTIRCNAYEDAAGVREEMAELRASLERETARADANLARYTETRAELAKLKAPKKRAAPKRRASV
jgi:hypothetical protein